MKKISKQQLLEELSIDIPDNIKAKEYSAKDDYVLVLSYSKVNNRVMSRIYCRGLEVFRFWDDDQDFKIRKYIKNTLNGYYYFNIKDDIWRIRSELDYYFRYHVVLNIEDCEDKVFKYIDKSIFNGFVYGGFKHEGFEWLSGMIDENVEYISKHGSIALLGIYFRTELDFSKQQFKFIVENNLTYNQAEMYLKYNLKNLEVLNKIDECSIDYEDYQFIKKFITIKKFIEYKNLNKRTANLYIDYLRMLNINDLPINKKTLMPKQIKKKHDELIEIINMIKLENKEKYLKSLDEKFIKPSKKFEKIETNNLKIVRLVDYNSFDLESKELNHCLRDSYFENAANGKTTILAVRQKDKIDKPYYTIEFKNGTVKQFYGKHNQSINKAKKYKKELIKIKELLNTLTV